MATGPHQWIAAYPACAGKSQSPLDITEVEAHVDPLLAPIQLNWFETITQSNLDHQTCTTEIRSDNLWIRGGPLANNETFFFSQFHAHEVSEHRINGLAYPVELHFVHKSSSGAIAVVAFFFKVAGENSSFLSEYIDFCTTNTSDNTISFENLLKYESDFGYYSYQGSLTTPPCTEDVTWILIDHIFDMSRMQLKDFKAKLPYAFANNRPIQELNQRLIRHFIPPGRSEHFIDKLQDWRMITLITVTAVAVGVLTFVTGGVCVVALVGPRIKRELDRRKKEHEVLRNELTELREHDGNKETVSPVGNNKEEVSVTPSL